MNENWKYQAENRMSDLIGENYPMVLVMSRFGITLGFGDKSIAEVCSLNNVDCYTFLAVANFLTKKDPISMDLKDTYNKLSLDTIILYLHNAHEYFINFRLPLIRQKLLDAISGCQPDIMFVIRNFFDEYAKEVQKHMAYEEQNVFPYVRSLLHGRQNNKYNIAIFQKRHDQIEMKIAELKNILIRYYPGEGSHLLNSVLFDIFTTEEDLASHNRVENYLFIPTIQLLEEKIK